MFLQHSGAVSAFGRRPRPLDTPPQTLQAKRRLIGRAEEAIAGIANESSAQVRMFNSTNASTNKPTLVVTYRPSHYGGGAGVYWNCTSTSPNCAGYAVGSNSYMDISVIKSGGIGSVDEREYANMVMDAYERLSGLVMTWEEEDANQDAYVPGNRFRIAIRAKLYTPYPDGLLNIYHVMVQLRDGSWASKMNTSPSRWCGLINVRTDSNEDNWDTLANPNLEYIHTMFFQVQGSYAP